MKLGILSGYSGRNMDLGIEKIQAAEDMGYESVWTAEAYGSDAVTPAAWILANHQEDESRYCNYAKCLREHPRVRQ